ncbi:MAG: cytochrome c oxidase subunit 3 [Gammaproteobacteria bacterium]|nr:cytochrome c oxidase subunit 3 [Gammaproteobacteria bacterium]
MSLYGQLTEKPWLTTPGSVDYLRIATPGRAKKIALRMFLAVVTVLFLLLITAYGDRMAYEDWRPAPQQKLLWVNTFMLVLASVALQWAVFAVRRARLDAMRAGLIAGGVFTVIFLIGQFLAWQQLRALTFFDMASPAIAFFYMITAIHGVHLLGGLVAWARALPNAWRDVEHSRIRQSVELCATYWHFLLLVWLVLFGLLFSGDNLQLLLKLCGIR